MLLEVQWNKQFLDRILFLRSIRRELTVLSALSSQNEIFSPRSQRKPFDAVEVPLKGEERIYEAAWKPSGPS